MFEAYIIDAVRTPRGIGKPGKGALLPSASATHSAATVLKALKDRNNINTAEVDDIIWSTSTQKGKQGGDLGRMAALDAGYIKASGMTLDRFCGGGITSVNLCGSAGHVRNGRSGHRGRNRDDVLYRNNCRRRTRSRASANGHGLGNRHLQRVHPQSHQGVCGDAIAAMEGISREAVDALGLESQRRQTLQWRRPPRRA
ncbi:MAG: hypothetical protein IPP45_19400 [Sphingomonadales bacterium]|nr:hypothetical protein [Sphingomonadales bacterium]